MSKLLKNIELLASCSDGANPLTDPTDSEVVSILDGFRSDGLIEIKRNLNTSAEIRITASGREAIKEWKGTVKDQSKMEKYKGHASKLFWIVVTALVGGAVAMYVRSNS